MILQADHLDTQTLNERIRSCEDSITIENCIGQRYIGCGLSDRNILIHGTPGNALGSYMNGSVIQVYGNAQDAVGDTMNDGTIIIHGNVQDACGYAMRGGTILIQGCAGYRCGVHMKRYEEHKPLIVIGKTAGSFLGEYLAGGTIVVLGLESDDFPVGNFVGNGMYDGSIYIRTKELDTNLIQHLKVEQVDIEKDTILLDSLNMFSKTFSIPLEELIDTPFFRLSSADKNAKQLHYIEN